MAFIAHIRPLAPTLSPGGGVGARGRRLRPDRDCGAVPRRCRPLSRMRERVGVRVFPGRDQPPAFSPSGRSTAPSASASRAVAEPGRFGVGWSGPGAQPDSHTISKVARTRPCGAGKLSA